MSDQKQLHTEAAQDSSNAGVQIYGDTDSRKSLFKKMAEVMGDIGSIEKRGWNDHFKYHYVLEEDVMQAIRNKLTAMGICVFVSVDSIEEKPTNITDAHMSISFCDQESGAVAVIRFSGRGQDKNDKGLYKAYTGGFKYGLLKNFMIPTGDDPERTETDAAGQRSASTKKQSSATQKTEKGTLDNITPAQQAALDQLGTIWEDGCKDSRITKVQLFTVIEPFFGKKAHNLNADELIALSGIVSGYGIYLGLEPEIMCKFEMVSNKQKGQLAKLSKERVENGDWSDEKRLYSWAKQILVEDYNQTERNIVSKTKLLAHEASLLIDELMKEK